MKKLTYLSACILLSASFQVFAQFNKVVQISHPGDKGASEVSISINPANPQNIIAAFMLRASSFPSIRSYTFVSRDGGKSWLKIEAQNPQKRIQGDDAITFGANGFAYHSYLSFFDAGREGKEQPSSGIYVSTSTDGGLSWPTRTYVVDHLNSSVPMEDKPYVVTDNATNSPYHNNLYIAWTHFAKYESHNTADSSQIYFSRSTDLGKSFSAPLRISTTGGDCLDSDNTVEGAVPAIGPNGEIYIVWGGPKGLVFTKSINGGKSFRKEQVIGYIKNGWDFNVPGIFRCNGMPVTKVDLSKGKNRGSIYVNWVDNRNGDNDVFVKYSRDEGKTWSNPVRVNDDSLGNGKDQFFTWMSVDPVDGSVNVVFYDRRGLDSTMTGVTLARSIDGGKTFKNYNIKQKPFKCYKHIFFGDYIGIDAYNGLVTPAYMHFIGKRNLAVSVAIFRFIPGTQEKSDDNKMKY